MKGTPRSLWLSAVNRAAGWWMGHAANAVRQAQKAALRKATPKPKRAPRRKR